MPDLVGLLLSPHAGKSAVLTTILSVQELKESKDIFIFFYPTRNTVESKQIMVRQKSLTQTLLALYVHSAMAYTRV